MARFILIALLALASSNLYAQFGVQVGYVYMPSNGNLRLGNPWGEFSGTTRNHGFNVGLTYEFRLRGHLGMQTAALYSFAGGRVRETRIIDGLNNLPAVQLTVSRYQFLELPVRVTYSLPVTNEFRFFFFGGPSFSYALSGRARSQLGNFFQFNNGEFYNVYEDFGDVLSPFELRVGGGLGVHYQNYRIRIGYDQGLLNLYNGTGRGKSLRRSQFSISFGYVF